MSPYDLNPTADGIVYAIHAITLEWLTSPTPRPHADVIAQIEEWVSEFRRAEAVALAASTVECYRAEFPGEGPDWDSDWWVYAWTLDGCPGTFDDYLKACRKAWEGVSTF